MSDTTCAPVCIPSRKGKDGVGNPSGVGGEEQIRVKTLREKIYIGRNKRRV